MKREKHLLAEFNSFVFFFIFFSYFSFFFLHTTNTRSRSSYSQLKKQRTRGTWREGHDDNNEWAIIIKKGSKWWKPERGENRNFRDERWDKGILLLLKFECKNETSCCFSLFIIKLLRWFKQDVRTCQSYCSSCERRVDNFLRIESNRHRNNLLHWW